MLFQAVFGPLATIYLLGIPSLLVMAIVGSFLVLIIEVGSEAGATGTVEITCAAIATLLVILYLGIHLYMTNYRKIEVYFSSFPWLRHNGDVPTKHDTSRSYPTRCPFTDNKPTLRCPSCGVHTSERAFNSSARRIAVPLGRVILRWEMARDITEKYSHDPATGRKKLDAILEYKGNYLNGGLSNCCVGCATWQRCFNLQPRLALSLAMISLFFAFSPWAFREFFVIMGSPAGAILQNIFSGMGIMYGGSAAALQLQLLFRTSVFAEKYMSRIPELTPAISKPTRPILMHVWNILAAAPWDKVN